MTHGMCLHLVPNKDTYNMKQHNSMASSLKYRREKKGNYTMETQNFIKGAV